MGNGLLPRSQCGGTTLPNKPLGHPHFKSEVKAPVDDENKSALSSFSFRALKNPCPTFLSSPWSVGVKIKDPQPGWGEIQPMEFC